MSVTLDAAGSIGTAVRVAKSPFRWNADVIDWTVASADAVVLALCAVALIPVAAASGVHHPAVFMLTSGLCEICLFLLVQVSISAYRLDSYLRLQESLVRAMLGLMLAWGAGVVAVVVARKLGVQTLSLFALTHLPQVVAVAGVRLAARSLAQHATTVGMARQRVLIIGTGPLAVRAIEHLSAPRYRHAFEVGGVVAEAVEAPSGRLAGCRLLGGLAVLPDLAQRELFDLAVITTPTCSNEELARVFDGLHYFATDVVIMMSDAFAQSYHGPRRDIAGLSMLPLAQRPLKGWRAVLKSLFDKTLAAIALLLLAPLFLLIAVLIRLDSPGPALFRQDRIGLNHRTFRIFKFRTMTVDPTDDGTVGTSSRGDRRITRVGRFLRSTSLDELPQILNVLNGDMSIVGPRPYVARMRVEDQTFDRLARSFAARHRVKPGITGLAQANGFRSHALRDKDKAIESVKLDLDYIANWSFWLDIQIIIRTALLAMSGPEVF